MDNKKSLIIDMLPDNETIMKRNNIIRMKQKSLSSILSKDALKLYNYLYFVFQVYRENIEGFDYSIKLKQTTIKEHLGIKSDDYYKIIKSSFKELLKTEVILTNFTIEETVVKEYETHLITSILDGEKFKDNKTKVFRVTIDKVLFNEMMKKESGYTLLDLEYIKPLKKTGQIRLYELCKSYFGMKKTPELDLDDLNDLFFTNHKYISKLYPLINNSIKNINDKTDLIIEYKVNKSKKTIQFNLKDNKENINKILNKKKDDIVERKYQELSIENQKIVDKLLKDNIV